MNTDRELLEAAAKAAGIQYEARYEHPVNSAPYPGLLLSFDYVKGAKWWDPLTDSGDALELAVKLRIVVQHAPRYVVAISPDLIAQHEDGITDAATRRAIVRAAAAIGANLE